MKRATGELNATVVVVLMIGVMAAFFFLVLWPDIKNSFIKESRCSDAMCDASTINSDGFADCVYKNKDGSQINMRCVWKG